MRNIAYCAGRDVAGRPMADAVLVPFDCWQNRAHITMLAEQGIVSAEQAKKDSPGRNRFPKGCGRRRAVSDS